MEKKPNYAAPYDFPFFNFFPKNLGGVKINEDRKRDEGIILKESKRMAFSEDEEYYVQHNVLVEIILDEITQRKNAELIQEWLSLKYDSERKKELNDGVICLIQRSLKRVKTWKTGGRMPTEKVKKDEDRHLN